MAIEGFFWTKFIIISLSLGVPLFIFAPTLKWKLLFTFVAVPLGTYLALTGRSINIHRKRQ